MDAGSLTALSVAIATGLADQLKEDDLIVLYTVLYVIATTLDSILTLRAIGGANRKNRI